MVSSIFADPSLADQCFPECGNLSYGKVFQKLSEKCSPLKERIEGGERIQKIESIQLSATNGFTSRVFRCKVKMCHLDNGNGPNDSSPFSLILKVITMDRANSLIASFLGEEKWAEMLKEMVEMKLAKEGNNGQSEIGGKSKLDEKTMAENIINNSFISNIHRNECSFYEFINASILDEQQCPIPIPKIYFTQLGMAGGQIDEAGLIAMEDLQDAHLADFANGFNEEQVLHLTTSLANLHAHILSNCGNNWQKQFITYDEMFGGENMRKEDSAKWMEAMKEQMKDERLAIPLKRLGRMFQGMEFFKWAQKKIEEELGIPEMLVHGDLWVNNILWQNKNENELAALIDWQLTLKGNPMMDIARLTSMSIEPELRHELEKDNRLLGHYLKTLNTKLAESGMEPVKYGVRELEVAYDLAMVGQSICCAMVVPFFERVWAEMPDLEHRLSRIGRRTLVAMADIVEKMEKLAPEWLLPAEIPKEGPMMVNGEGQN